MSGCSKFLILGSQRSGSTLLGMALQAHKDIEIIEENNPAFHVRPASAPIHIDLRAVREYQPGDGKAVGFKAPRDSHRVAEIFASVPHVRIAWIHRDIFQVVASMVSLRMPSGATWAGSFAHEEIIKYLLVERQDTAVAELYQWSCSLTDESERAIALAAVCWFCKRRIELRAVREWPASMHRIGYEDLVRDPEQTLGRLLAFLELAWNPAILDHPSFISGSRPGGSRTSRAIDSESLYKWKTQLSENDLALIEHIIRKLQ